jgi:hypothetical protein
MTGSLQILEMASGQISILKILNIVYAEAQYGNMVPVMIEQAEKR